jgi:hypothetical protein
MNGKKDVFEKIPIFTTLVIARYEAITETGLERLMLVTRLSDCHVVPPRNDKF